jgi:hypothetical protein
MAVTLLPTEIHLRWPTIDQLGVELDIRLGCRTIRSDELRMLADVVASIEELREVVIGELPELQ